MLFKKLHVPFLRTAAVLAFLLIMAVFIYAFDGAHIDQEQILNTLRPWAESLDDSRVQQLFGPLISVFFFLTILSISKRLT